VFTAAAYLKDLGDFDRAQTESSSYITEENHRLFNTKLEMETGFSRSLVASERLPPSDSAVSSIPGSEHQASSKF
jgi:hypothetical protein